MNIAFIPVRSGSKSIPFKNIKEFCKKPLVYWNLQALEKAKYIDRVVVATDSDEIKKIVLDMHFSKVTVYDREKENAQDTSSTESVMLEFIGKNDFDDNDVFVLAQATSPFTQENNFDEAILQYQNDNIDSLLSCVKSKRFFWNIEGKPLNYNYENRPRRQDFDGLYMENGAFYINKVKNIKKFNNRLSGKIGIYEMPEYSSIEIDEYDDWILAEKIMCNRILSKDTRENINIKLFLSDVDGVLTDAGMYYSENGDELKKFNTKDGMGFELLRKHGIKTGLITSENSKIVEKRAEKLQIDYVYQGKQFDTKLEKVREICKKEKVTLENVAYIGDDINCKELLENVGIAACPSDAILEIQNIPGIMVLSKKGGEGVAREFIDIILN